MEQDLKEMRSRLNALPVLHARLEKLRSQLCEAETAVYELKKKYESETQDVNELQNGGFSSAFLKLIGQYEGKLTKETQEQLRAKAAYDEAKIKLDDVRSQQHDLLKRISDLKTEERVYEAALEQRKSYILSNVGSDAYSRYMETLHQLAELEKQVTETDEALRAAHRADSTARYALDTLDSAHGWATYDVWGGGGILSHMAKYDHLDQAEESMVRLDVQIRSLQKELKDVRFQGNANFQMVDSTTRAVDFWLDNIFTDLNVRSVISENQDRLRTLCGQLKRLSDTLQTDKNLLQSQIRNLESIQESLLIE